MNVVERRFVQTVWSYYERHGRRSLPWRNTKNPYHILVSEIMLQQTQVDRVISKYHDFLKRFPTIQKLSNSSLADVLIVWQGLGYNRRAKMLHECAKQIIVEYHGRFPKRYDELLELRGVGPYTAGAIMAFAYNRAIPIIETNIRSVYLHHFFNDDIDVHDREIVAYVKRTLENTNVREWYYALMDYGVHIKKEFGNPNKRSAHFVTQSSFKNSERQIRGAIITLLTQETATRKKIHRKLPFDIDRIDAQLEKLIYEKMIEKNKSHYRLPI